jgi:hypothetical protein
MLGERKTLVDTVRYSIYWIRCCIMETTWEPCVCQSSSQAGQWQIAFAVLEYPLFFFLLSSVSTPILPSRAFPTSLALYAFFCRHFLSGVSVTLCRVCTACVISTSRLSSIRLFVRQEVLAKIYWKHTFSKSRINLILHLTGQNLK